MSYVSDFGLLTDNFIAINAINELKSGSVPRLVRVKTADKSSDNDNKNALSLEVIRDHLERRLSWYGMRSVRIGPFERARDGRLLVHLLDIDGEILDCVEVDRISGNMCAMPGQPGLWTRFSERRSAQDNKKPTLARGGWRKRVLAMASQLGLGPRTTR